MPAKEPACAKILTTLAHPISPAPVNDADLACCESFYQTGRVVVDRSIRESDGAAHLADGICVRFERDPRLAVGTSHR
jgi:hypothetical protein